MTPAEIAIVNAVDTLRDRVRVLAEELPNVTFGYIGNCGVDRGGRFDDRSWAVFLPHPGRVGTSADQVSVGSTDRLPAAVADWPRIAEAARRLYHNGSDRVVRCYVCHQPAPVINVWYQCPTCEARDGSGRSGLGGAR